MVVAERVDVRSRRAGRYLFTELLCHRAGGPETMTAPSVGETAFGVTLPDFVKLLGSVAPSADHLEAPELAVELAQQRARRLQRGRGGLVEAEHELAERGYIIGALQRVIFYTPGVKETNWSATAPVAGPDGVTRRWVYLHYFKQGQPSINWLDPTFAGMRLVIGDALHSLGELGTTALRLDANGFLGVEKSAEGLPAWSEGHPLSHAANHIIGGMVRKVGGFTFQELNLTMEDIRDTGAVGADLSYDFVGRPGYHHALATGQTEFLRLALTTSLELGVEPVQLVHGLQNHDELTYELVHWATRHADDEYRFRGAEITGGDLAELVRAELTESLTGTADYNRVFTQNGIACTTTSLIAATRGFARRLPIGFQGVQLSGFVFLRPQADARSFEHRRQKAAQETHGLSLAGPRTLQHPLHISGWRRKEMPRPEILRHFLSQEVGILHEFGIEGGPTLEGIFLQHAIAETVDGGDLCFIEIPQHTSKTFKVDFGV